MQYIQESMIKELQIKVLPQVAYSEHNIGDYLSKEWGIDRRTIHHIRVLRKSIDARQRTIFVNLKLQVFINEYPEDDGYPLTHYPDVSSGRSVVVVGEGPGGLFASLRLIELGYRPIVLERGKNVRERKYDLSYIKRTQSVDPNSNYSFGEGGAGAYSDGKLYTRSKKRGSVEKILHVFCQHGASLSILSDSHPHIGTDKLPGVIANMRNRIIESGGEVHFQTKMTGLIIEGERVLGVQATDLTTGRELEFYGPVILATGHSARDVYSYLASSKIEIEAKGIAVGVRLEHPVQVIDQIMYHNKHGRGKYLPAAEYSMVSQVAGRGVYSFCMCPGGYVVPAATGPEQIVVNGMSPSNRGTKWSNSGMVVEIRPEDIPGNDVLRLMHYQEQLEKQCWEEGNRKQTAPSQRMVDFVERRASFDLPPASYAPGLVSSRLDKWMPKDIVFRLREGFLNFGQKYRGFLTNEAVMIGMETRTSSPIRVTRVADTLQHVRLAGLFPCGEGAGYAGGIVSAAMDGEKCAEMCAAYLKSL